MGNFYGKYYVGPKVEGLVVCVLPNLYASMMKRMQERQEKLNKVASGGKWWTVVEGFKASWQAIEDMEIGLRVKKKRLSELPLALKLI